MANRYNDFVNSLNDQNHKDFYFDISDNKLLGYEHVTVYGQNPDIDTAADEDIWVQGGNYNYVTSGVFLYMSSSASGDKQPIKIDGLNENWQRFSLTVNLDDTNAVQIGTGETFQRLLHAQNIGVSGLGGDVYFYENDTVTSGVPDTATKVHGHIGQGAERTQLAMYSIPSGYTGYITHYYGSVSKQTAAAVDFNLRIREEGGVFKLTHSIGTHSQGSTLGRFHFEPPILVEQRSDIKMDAGTSANNTYVRGGFSLILHSGVA